MKALQGLWKLNFEYRNMLLFMSEAVQGSKSKSSSLSRAKPCHRGICRAWPERSVKQMEENESSHGIELHLASITISTHPSFIYPQQYIRYISHTMTTLITAISPIQTSSPIFMILEAACIQTNHHQKRPEPITKNVFASIITHAKGIVKNNDQTMIKRSLGYMIN
jgi:hypothetical protein